MDIELNYEQRAQLELISMHAGTSPAHVLLEAAEFLLRLDPDTFLPQPDDKSQLFLTDAELEARFTRLLRH